MYPDGNTSHFVLYFPNSFYVTSIRDPSHLTTTIHFHVYFLSPGVKKGKWVTWLLMIPFTLDDKKIMPLSSSMNGPLALLYNGVLHKLSAIQHYQICFSCHSKSTSPILSISLKCDPDKHFEFQFNIYWHHAVGAHEEENCKYMGIQSWQ